MKKIKDIILKAFAAILIIFLAYLLIGGIMKKRSLDINIEDTTAVVIDHFFSIKNDYYYSYTFTIEGKEYHGTGFHYPKTDTIKAGDVIRIVYDTTNPDNNKAWRDY